MKKNIFAASIDYQQFDMTYISLDKSLALGSSAKIFSCYSNLSDDFFNVTPFRGNDMIPYKNYYDGPVYLPDMAKDAVNYLEQKYENEYGYTYEAY